MNATAKQLQHIHAALHSKGLLQHKRDMVAGYTNGRTESSREMTVEEAAAMLADLNEQRSDDEKKQKMIRHIIAMCHEMGWITESVVVSQESGAGALKKKKDYSRMHQWIESHVYKKPLGRHSYQQLTVLVSVFKKVYSSFLKQIKPQQ